MGGAMEIDRWNRDNGKVRSLGLGQKTPNHILLLTFILFFISSCANLPSERMSEASLRSSPKKTHGITLPPAWTATITPTPTATSTPTPFPTSTPPPTLTHTPKPTSTGTEAILENLTEKELDAFLRVKLSVSSEFEFAFERGILSDSGEEELIVFYVLSSLWHTIPKRGIITNSNGALRLEMVEEDPCYCTGMDSIGQKHLVPSRPPFIIVEYSPITGTCYGVVALEILIIEEGNYFKQALKTYTFLADGTPSEMGSGLIAQIADVEYEDIDGDGNSEIIEYGKFINCGENCFCDEGPVEGEFQNVYTWDETTETFVEWFTD
jgi:hypothetical protein